MIRKAFSIWQIGLWLVVTATIVQAQYTLDEVGAALGGGYVTFPNPEQRLSGPGLNVNAFYSHYFCGKSYGFQLSAGIYAFQSHTSDGAPFLDEGDAGRTAFVFSGLDLGAFFKIKARDFHRPRETAIVFGPKVLLPFLTRYDSEVSTGGLSKQVESVARFQLGAELSLQVRRPAGKKSWFIQPGAAYYLSPAFTQPPAGELRNLYIFLNFGFAFWDKRG